MSVYAAEASKHVVVAEKEILRAVEKRPSGYTPDELVESLTKKNKAKVSDDEVREAIWRLLATGDLELSDDLKLTPPD